MDNAAGAAGSVQTIWDALMRGGPALILIAGLSVLALTLILWKLWRSLRVGQASPDAVEAALQDWTQGKGADHMAQLRGPVAVTLAQAMALSERLPEGAAREDATRIARLHLAEARSGLRGLEVIATIAPLLGLLGTVLGMIAAFQALQSSGAGADPAVLAGGIWEALLTTAAGMAVAIPASVALSLFEGRADRLQARLEDGLTRVFVGAVR